MCVSRPVAAAGASTGTGDVFRDESHQGGPPDGRTDVQIDEY